MDQDPHGPVAAGGLAGAGLLSLSWSTALGWALLAAAVAVAVVMTTVRLRRR